jgi:hypothetical protein
MLDPFIGTWTLNPTKSTFDPNHRPAAATMRWESEADGGYLMTAEGVNGKQERVSERPQRFVPDGHPVALPGFPGLVTVATRPDARTIRAEVRREDGSIAGEGTYVVDENGVTMTATTAGFDLQLRRFETRTVWDRQQR